MSMEGLVVGRYRITRKLAEGGMAEVYEGWDEGMRRFAALKFLRPEMSAMATMVQRFFQEARAAASIAHPGTVHIYEVGHTADGRAFLAMERLHGETLHQRLMPKETLRERLKSKKTLSLEATISVIRQLASVMGAAHQRGIIHRDLKPDNVFLARDSAMPAGERVKVLDFGLAKLLEVAAPLVEPTAHGAVFGTPAYMAPEQCRSSGEVDPRADLYAIGCIFYRCLCGRAPFGTGQLEVLLAQVSQAPVAPRRFRPDIPPAIEELILQLLAKDRDQRPPSCETFIAQLDRAVEKLPAAARSVSPPVIDDDTVQDNPTLRGAVAHAVMQQANTAQPAHGEPAAATPRPEPTQPLDPRALMPVGQPEPGRGVLVADPTSTTVMALEDDIEQLSEYELESVVVLPEAERPWQPARAHDVAPQPAEARAAGEEEARPGEDVARSSSPSLSRGELGPLPPRTAWRSGDRRSLLAVAVFGCMGALVAAGLLIARAVDAPATDAEPSHEAGQAQQRTPWEHLAEIARPHRDAYAAFVALLQQGARQARAQVAEREAEVRAKVQRLLRRRSCKALARLAAQVTSELPAMQGELERDSADCLKAPASARQTNTGGLRPRFTAPATGRPVPRPRVDGRCPAEPSSGRKAEARCRAAPDAPRSRFAVSKPAPSPRAPAPR
jgi:serine/threonine protein kinase